MEQDKPRIILPETIFGRNVEGAMERVLKGDKTPEVLEQPIPQTNAANLKGFIYVPSIQIYVAKERTLTNLTWGQTQEELKKQNLAMPTPYHFREFLKYLRDSKNSEHQGIFKEITEVREPWRAEWLNAKFEKRKDGLYMVSENVLTKGKYENAEQKLDDFLDKDKTPGISLDSWLDSTTIHGLPEKKIQKGELYYWSPEAGRVARFDAYSVRAYLYCSRHPDNSNSSLGVRLVVRPKGASAQKK